MFETILVPTDGSEHAKKAVLLASDIAAKYQARFRGVAFPGETYQTRVWREDGRLLVEAWSVERGEIILSNGCVTLR